MLASPSPSQETVRTNEEVELVPLTEHAEGSAPRHGLPDGKKRWSLPPIEEVWQALQQPRLQRKLWLVAALLVAVVAGVVLLISRPGAASSGNSSNSALPIQASVTGTTADAPKAASASPNSKTAAVAFPSQPWLQPAGTCNTGSKSLGPATVVHTPLSYRVFLSFEDQHFASSDNDVVAGGFKVATNITMAVIEETACISLHASNLSFSSIHAMIVSTEGTDDDLHQQQGQPTCLCGSDAGCLTDDCGRLFRQFPAADNDSWLMSLGTLTAPAGSSLLITTQHTAHFGNKEGVWRSSPFAKADTDGVPSPGAEQQVMISTQFEPKGARMLFPCMDDPKYKAPIVVVIEAPSHLTILSNMPEAKRSTINTSSSGGKMLLEFIPSLPMSTYLMAVAVGDLEAVTAHTTGGKKINVWFPRGQPWISPAAVAVPLQLAVAAFEHYTRYTRVPQPLTKFDLVAVAGKSGAMENWGLLMFDPERFLYTSPGVWALLRCATVICHEVAHQWFGNLVTAASWGDLLVNEGVASLAEYGCLAEVLRTQLGTTGAAAVMRHVAGPHGKIPGVHEGPFNKALTYDALPTAAPLLGSAASASGDVDFGVLAYSKPASVLAMLVEYAAAGSPTAVSYQSALKAGPVTQLVDSSPPSTTQVFLQQYLHQHIYGSASAQQVFELFLSHTDEAMSSNAMAVISGWRAPGSPLMMVTQSPQGQQVEVRSGRRFCLHGMLNSTTVTALLANPDHLLSEGLAAGGSVAGENQTSSAVGLDLMLTCPQQSDDAGGDRAVPWTPVYLRPLPATSNATYSIEAGSSSPDRLNESSKIGSQAGDCGAWYVIRQDSQTLNVPASDSCKTAARSTSNNSASLGQLLVIEGDGGWGLYWSVYPAAQRAAVRNWAKSELLTELTLRQQHQTGVQPKGPAAASTAALTDLQLLFTAAKLLGDQAVVGLSPFNDVPGWEVLMAVQAAYHVTAEAAAAASDGALGLQVFGHVLYSLLVPVLPASEVLMERVVTNTGCRSQLQAKLSALSRPVTAAAVQLFAPQNKVKPSTVTLNSTLQQYTTPGQFLGSLSLSTLLTTTAMLDPVIANQLCRMFNAAAAASVAASGSVGADLMAQLQPDLQDAVLATAASRPAGCQIDMTGGQLDDLLQRLYLSSPNAAVCQRAAFALAHSSTGATTAAPAGTTPPAWQVNLAVLLGMDISSSSQSKGTVAGPAAASPLPACGIGYATHAVEFAKLVSKAVTSSLARQASGNNQSYPMVVAGVESAGPVLDFMMQHWQQAVEVLGSSTAWQVIHDVAVQEVVTVQQWQRLAAWVVQQHKKDHQQEQKQTGMDTVQQQQGQLASVLGAAWSTVAWIRQNQETVCSHLL